MEYILGNYTGGRMSELREYMNGNNKSLDDILQEIAGMPTIDSDNDPELQADLAEGRRIEAVLAHKANGATMSDRKPIEEVIKKAFNIVYEKEHFDLMNEPEIEREYAYEIFEQGYKSRVKQLETEHNELLSKAEELEKRYQQKCEMFNSQSEVLRIKEEKIRDLIKQRDIAVELLERVLKQGGIHTVTSMDIVEFLTEINQIGEK